MEIRDKSAPLQTAVPITCVFIPYFTVLTMPFLAIDGGFLNVGCTACISFFPTLDAVVIIWLMTDYRYYACHEYHLAPGNVY